MNCLVFTNSYVLLFLAYVEIIGGLMFECLDITKTYRHVCDLALSAGIGLCWIHNWLVVTCLRYDDPCACDRICAVVSNITANGAGITLTTTTFAGKGRHCL